MDHKLIHAIALQRFRFEMFTSRGIVIANELTRLVLELMKFGEARVARRC